MSVAPKSITVNDIPGWFPTLDQQLFSVILGQQAADPLGTLVELGTYLGKSAVVLGEFRRPGERIVVVDLFENVGLLCGGSSDDANLREHQAWYGALTRRGIEENYLAIHGDLPEIVEGRSSDVVDHVESNSARFVHIDASHLYANVRRDIESAKRILRPGAMVVIDDYRSEHTPGVAAAVWEAVMTAGLIPVALSGQKFYGVFDGPDPYARCITRWVETSEHCWMEQQDVGGHLVLRLKQVDTGGAVEPRIQALARQVADLERAVDHRDEQLRVRRERIVSLRTEIRRLNRAYHNTRSELNRLHRSPEFRAAHLVRRVLRTLTPRGFAHAVDSRLTRMRNRRNHPQGTADPTS